MKMLKDNLVQLRKLNSLTQEKVAEKVGVSRQAVAKWEAGAICRRLYCHDGFGCSLGLRTMDA